MKNLKIVYAHDINEKLCYPLYELILLDNGYYKIQKCGNNFNSNKCCYQITEENKILEVLYKDKVVTFNQVLRDLYIPTEKNKVLYKKI